MTTVTSLPARAASINISASPLDFAVPGQLEAAFATLFQQWDRLDVLVRSVGYAQHQDLQGGLLNCSAEGFAPLHHRRGGRRLSTRLEGDKSLAGRIPTRQSPEALHSHASAGTG